MKKYFKYISDFSKLNALMDITICRIIVLKFIMFIQLFTFNPLIATSSNSIETEVLCMSRLANFLL